MKKIFLVFLAALFLAGCAISTRYVSYTAQKFTPKQKYYFITIYPPSSEPLPTETYTVIGKVELYGTIDNGVTPDSLMDAAKVVARQRGADAIINGMTREINYDKINKVPGYFRHHYYRPPQYYIHGEKLFVFTGELIVFVSKLPPEKV